MALPKLDNTDVEANQKIIIQKMDGLQNVLEKMSDSTTLERMLPFVVQIADNIYNIAGKLDAQVTSFKEVQEALKDQAKSNTALAQPNEGMQIEQQREAAAGKGKEEKAKPEEKKRSFWDKLGDIFEKVLIPLIFSFVVSFSKALGGFDSVIGKLVTIFAALYLSLSGFRKKVNSLVVEGFKKIFSKPSAPPGGAPGKPQIPGKGGVPGETPKTPDVKGGKAGPSGLDKFLEGAKKTGKAIKDLFVGIADTIKQILGKLADGIKQFISKVSEGVKVLLQNIAKGIESFGKGSVLKGAAALVVVAGALYIAAKAFKEFGGVEWESVAKGVVGITGLIVVMKLLEKATGSMIKGALALTIMSGALFLAGKAFQTFADVSWEDLAVAGVGITGLAVALMLLGPALPIIAPGAAALVLMSGALAAFGLAVQVLAKGLPALSEFLTQLSTIDGANLLLAAGGITAIGGALMALGAGQVIQALGNFVSSILSFGKEDIFTKLTNLGKVAGDLNKLPDTIKALGDLSNFQVSSNFMKNVDILSEGLKKIASASQGFEKTGDSLTALSKIAETLNKPAATGATAGAAAPGKPAGAVAGATAGKSAVTAPGTAPGRPAAGGQPAGTGEAAISGFQEKDYEKEIQAKIAADPTAKQDPQGARKAAVMEVRQEVITGKLKPRGPMQVTPVATAPQGAAMNADSQKVAAAQGAGGGGGGQTNIVAPQSSVVNAPSSQTVNAPLSAYGIFGGRTSQGLAFGANF